MKKRSTASSQLVIAAALSLSLLPLTAAHAQSDPQYPRASEGTTVQEQNYDQRMRGSQGPLRSDIDSATPTYSGENRQQFQSETPGSQGPVRSEDSQAGSSQMSPAGDPYQGSAGPARSETESSAQQSWSQDSYRRDGSRGAEGPLRSEMDDSSGMRTGRSAGCPSASEKTAPNAYYGEGDPFSSAGGKAAFLGKGKWCP